MVSEETLSEVRMIRWRPSDLKAVDRAADKAGISFAEFVRNAAALAAALQESK